MNCHKVKDYINIMNKVEFQSKDDTLRQKHHILPDEPDYFGIQHTQVEGISNEPLGLKSVMVSDMKPDIICLMRFGLSHDNMMALASKPNQAIKDNNYE